MAEFTQTTYPVDPEAGKDPIPDNDKEQIENLINSSITLTSKEIPLTTDIFTDIDTEKVPYYQYAAEGNKVFVNLNIPLTKPLTGTVVIGQLKEYLPTSIRRIPGLLHNGTDPEALFGYLQISTDGNISVVPISSSTIWKRIAANGYFVI